MGGRMINKEYGKRSFCGIITVEMSYLIPIVLIVFLLIVYTVFYYHDKNILIGAASETATVGAQMERRPDKKGQVSLEEFYQERIRGKLIFFSGVQISVNTSRKWVEIEAYASRRKMHIHILQRAAITEPEKAIRRKWLIENIVHMDEADSNNCLDDAGTNNRSNSEDIEGIEGAGLD